jgi:hypothetical protein
MTLMTASALDQFRRKVAVSLSWTRVLALLFALVGVVFMHQLAGTAEPGGHQHDVDQAVVAEDAVQVAAAGDASHGVASVSAPSPPGGDCPDAPHGHLGHVCQLTAPSHGFVAPSPALALAPGALPPLRAVLSPVTAARDTAGGSGCGPPSLTELNIWRI